MNRKVAGFIIRQIEQIREGGLPVLLRKGRRLFELLPGLIAVLLMRALGPIVLIRFGQLGSDRIGDFAAGPEIYLCKCDAGMHGRRTFDIFYHTSPVCNHQLKKMWGRTLRVCRLAGSLDKVNRQVPGYEKHVIRMWDRDVHGLLRRTRVHLSFTAEEERIGRASLQELGIPEGSPFICFHARDLAYLDAMFPSRKWRYHDYRDCNICNYIPAAEELTRRGYFAIRMGAIVQEALNTTNPRIIDYATNGRADFLDIYLGAKCRFFLCSDAGIYAISAIFRRPVAFVNFIPLERVHTWNPDDLFIPKKVWLRKERRLLSFREILESGIGRLTKAEQYNQLAIEVVENTPEEITAVAVEMDERLKGTWKTSGEDEELQRRFWSIFKSSELHGAIVSRMGAEFLRQNRDLLGKMKK